MSGPKVRSATAVSRLLVRLVDVLELVVLELEDRGVFVLTTRLDADPHLDEDLCPTDEDRLEAAATFALCAIWRHTWFAMSIVASSRK